MASHSASTSSQLGIHSTRTLSVRYKAVGFTLELRGDASLPVCVRHQQRLHAGPQRPVAVQSAGPLGDLLKIAGARIAQLNPLTIEIDLVIKQDLGVITVDEFLIKLPLDGGGIR